MKELLLSEINNEVADPIEALVLIEEFIFSYQVTLDEVEILTKHCENEISNIEDTLESAEHLINEIYVHQLFIDKTRAVWSVASHQLTDALSFRIISPILKSILLKHIFLACGFETDIIFVPEKIMLRIICGDDCAIIFEPITGESLSWHDLDERLAEFDQDINESVIQPIETQDIIYKYVSSLKSSLIIEQQFDKALKCVDVLLAMRPNDPFERRDRGFLLHQLDCFKVAYDDYRFFVEQCPQDPAAKLLKHQLDNILINDTVLH